jgi:hypothetical protein
MFTKKSKNTNNNGANPFNPEGKYLNDDWDCFNLARDRILLDYSSSN